MWAVTPRELVRLALEWRWSVEGYLRGQLAALVDVLSRYGEAQGLNDSEVVEEAARLLNTLSKGIPPRLVEALEEANIVLNVSLYSHRLTALPEDESWIGRRWVFQIPAYYWALRTMVEEGVPDIEPGRVLEVIRSSVRR